MRGRAIAGDGESDRVEEGIKVFTASSARCSAR